MIRIAIASGKGGTGKTTVATSLAIAVKSHLGPSRPVQLLDADVEAPNAHLFLAPDFAQRQPVGILIPRVDAERCTGCGRCAEVCQFHAIAVIAGRTLVFPELCHGCGSCTLACPEEAITEELDVMGSLEAGNTPAGISFGRGLMNVGEPMAVPIIRQLKRWPALPQAPDGVQIVDSPPGTSCPVVEAVRGADFALLVTEPTPFGLHDLRLMVQVVRELNIPAGVVINRDGAGDSSVQSYCHAEGLPVLLRIPLDRAIGTGIAQGRPLVEFRPDLLPEFVHLFRQIETLAGLKAETGQHP